MVHASPEFSLDLPQLRLQTFADRLPNHREPSFARLPAEVRESEKIERFRLPVATLLPVSGREAAKLQQSLFLRRQSNPDFLHPPLNFSPDPPATRLPLKPHHDVARIAHYDH